MAGLLVAALGFGLFGCGGGGGDSLTKAEFVRRGNDICRAAEIQRGRALEAKAKSFGVKPGGLATPAQQAQIILFALDSYERMTEELGDLPTPDGDEEEIDGMVAAMEETAEKVRADPGTATHSQIQFKAAAEKLEKYGLDLCAV